MKKVIREEEAKINKFSLKKLTLKALAVILSITIPLSLSACNKKEETKKASVTTDQKVGVVTRDHTFNNPFDNFKVDSNINSISEDELNSDRENLQNNNAKEGFEDFEVMYLANDPDLCPYSPTAQILVDDIILELVHPEEVEVNGRMIYKAPTGFVLKGDICYRLLSTTGVAPIGYVLGMDGKTLYEVDTEIQYVVPEELNHFLVGSKEVEVIHTRKEQKGNLTYDMLPMEYERVNDFGYIISDAEPLQTLSR